MKLGYIKTLKLYHHLPNATAKLTSPFISNDHLHMQNVGRHTNNNRSKHTVALTEDGL